MINYETQKGSFEANLNSYFQNIGVQGFNTDHNKPTSVNYMGDNTAISFDYAKRSDGRFMLQSGSTSAAHSIGNGYTYRNKYEFFHPVALKLRNEINNL